MLLFASIFPTITLFLIKSWNDQNIYDSTPPVTNITFNTTQTSHYTTVDVKVWILNSLFGPISYSLGNGGAISHSNTGEVLIEFCSFKQCIITSQIYSSGAIYISQSNIVLNKCCGYQCYTQSPDHYGLFLYTDLSYTSKCNLLDISVAHSMESYTTPTVGDPLNLIGGTMLLHTINISDNFCKQYSAFQCTPNSATSAQHYVLFASINGNHASEISIILFYARDGNPICTFDVTYCNIIYNFDSGGNGLLYSHHNVQVKECCFMNNTASYLFYGVRETGCNIHVVNCTVDHDQDNLTAGSVILSSGVWTATSHFLIPIKCTEKEGYCIASYDSVGDLIIEEIDEGSQELQSIKDWFFSLLFGRD